MKDWIFQNFVLDLLIHTTAAEGRLSLEKNIGTGRLIEAIQMLTPYLPDGFVAERLSMSTLQRLKDSRSGGKKDSRWVGPSLVR